MEIIKHGQIPEHRVQFRCDYCGCVFIANYGEFTYNMYRNEEYYSARCPECFKSCHNDIGTGAKHDQP